MRPGTGPQAGGPGLGSPAGPGLGTGADPGSLLAGGRGREVLGSLQVGRARPAGRGGNPGLRAGGFGRVGFFTVGGCGLPGAARDR